LRKKFEAVGQGQTGILISWGIHFFLAAVLTAAQLPAGYAPFALGCIAASGSGAASIAALLGTGVGAVLFLDFQNGLPHLAAAVLLCTAGTALHGLKLWQKPLACPLCASGLFLIVKGIYIVQSSDPAGDLFPCLTAAVLVGVSAWFYAPLLRGDEPSAEPVPLRFLILTVLCAFTGLGLGAVDVGRILTAALVLVTAWQEGTAAGMTTGLCAGLLIDLCADMGYPLFTAVYGFGGLLAGSRAGRRRISAAAAFLCAGGLLALPLSGALRGALLEETLAASAVFLLIPGRVFGGKRIEKAQPASGAPVVEKLKAQMAQAAAAFRDLYDSLGRTASRDAEENPAVVFDRAAERVCRSCALCQLCWKKEYVSTFNALNDATPFLIERGRALPKDFPRHFADRCIHLQDFLAAVNTELSAFLLRGQYRRQLEDTRRSARGQYAQLGELLSATAAGLGESKTVAAQAGRPYRIGAALRPKEGENVCGDSVSSFETDGGFLCLLLSDGCGSGEEARKESALTNRLLRQFLEAAIEPEAALKTLNAALALRSEETGSFSTIDLMTVTLHTGEAALYKYGAAPTYVKKGGNIRRITGSALPAGLRDSPAPPDVTRLKLEAGSFAVMVSDGVVDALSDEWLQDLLAGWDGGDPQLLAGLVVQEAARRGRMADDCAVQVLLLENASGDKKPV
jgi:stage II sporulation protein E